MPRRPSPPPPASAPAAGSSAPPAARGDGQPPRRATGSHTRTTGGARRRAPPRYDYDGLSGLFLKLPWWGHLLLATLAYPLCAYALPLLPAHEPWQATLLHEWAPRAWPLFVTGFVASGVASRVRAGRATAGRKAGKPRQRR